MNSFTWIATIMSMVLGLGVARLLTDFINAVRARRATRIDWVPLTWAFCIFLTQIQFWWAFGQLADSKPVWDFVNFLGLVTMVVLLFAAAAQLLPSSDSEREGELRQFFAERGRWALVTSPRIGCYSESSSTRLLCRTCASNPSTCHRSCRHGN